MEKKINIAELLKYCPVGTELDCSMYDGVKLDYVNMDDEYPIRIKTRTGVIVYLTKYGQSDNTEDAKCVIFPKDGIEWEYFVTSVL